LHRVFVWQRECLKACGGHLKQLL